MDVQKLNLNLQQLKDQLKNLISVSADLIDRNSLIDNGARCDNLPPLPRFEILLEDFLSTCSVIELNLRTMQECIILGKASSQNLPLSVSNLKCDLDNRVETIEPNSTVSYNQYISVIKYQVDTAKAIKSLLEEFVNNQTKLQHHQQQHQHQMT
uniref:Mediator of RNA polymerase II transcription subunit 29 n=1 Tax=Aceria tosichella TaxID=561515 RepID=A0A6G1SPI4_9ACAR